MEEIFICECNSFEHQCMFWYDEEDDILTFIPHLITRRNFFERFYYGLKYAFGHKSRYGEWDSMMFKTKDLKKLKEHLNNKVK